MERKIINADSTDTVVVSEINTIIRDRRTVYPEQYSDREVPKEIIEQILTNATWAPTHGKTQPWRFKVYSGEGRNILWEKVRELYEECTPEEDYSKHKLARIEKRIQSTSVLVLLIMRRTEDTKIPLYEEMGAVAAAAQNMLLTSSANGVGSFWSSPKFLYTPQANQSFDLKEDDIIQGLLYFGYTDTDLPKSQRRSIDEVTEWFD